MYQKPKAASSATAKKPPTKAAKPWGAAMDKARKNKKGCGCASCRGKG